MGHLQVASPGKWAGRNLEASGQHRGPAGGQRAAGARLGRALGGRGDAGQRPDGLQWGRSRAAGGQRWGRPRAPGGQRLQGLRAAGRAPGGRRLLAAREVGRAPSEQRLLGPRAAGRAPGGQRLLAPRAAGRAPGGQHGAAAAAGQRGAGTARAAGERRRGEIGAAAAAAVIAPRERVLEGGVQSPFAAAVRGAGAAGQAEEAGVEAEVVADAVLPALRAAAVIGKAARDVAVDSAERQALLGAGPDGHGDESRVGVRRLLQGRAARGELRLVPHRPAALRFCPAVPRAAPPSPLPSLPAPSPVRLGSRAGQDGAFPRQTRARQRAKAAGSPGARGHSGGTRRGDGTATCGRAEPSSRTPVLVDSDPCGVCSPPQQLRGAPRGTAVQRCRHRVGPQFTPRVQMCL